MEPIEEVDAEKLMGDIASLYDEAKIPDKDGVCAQIERMLPEFEHALNEKKENDEKQP